jgi:hypothetical protein
MLVRSHAYKKKKEGYTTASRMAAIVLGLKKKRRRKKNVHIHMHDYLSLFVRLIAITK